MDKDRLLPEDSVSPKTKTTCPFKFLHRTFEYHRKISRKKLVGISGACVLALIFITIGCLSSHSTAKKCSIPSAMLHWKFDTKQRPPDSIIIGVRKAGTGALFHYLKLHPNISMADAEPNYFSYKYSRGRDWYISRMPYSFPWQITMEKSSNNFHNKQAPGRTYAFNSKLKLIVVVREPVHRAISDYTQRVVNNKLDVNFENAAVINGEINESYMCLKPSYYYKHLQRWLKYFPRKQIYIVDGERMIKNPYKEILTIETFLELPHSIPEQTFIYNATKGFYCFKNLQNEEHCLGSNKGREHIPVDKQLIERLHEHFKPWNKKFFMQIGEVFEWGY